MAGDRKAMEKERENLILELESRVKQLNCLYGASELLSLSGEKNEDIPKRIAGLLAHSLGNSQLSAARISIKGRSYQSPGWHASPWMLQTDLVVDRKTIGAIEVAFFRRSDSSDRVTGGGTKPSGFPGENDIVPYQPENGRNSPSGERKSPPDHF